MRTSQHFLAAAAIACIATSPISWGQELQAPATAPMVKSIDVQFAGPSTVSKERILNNMRTKVGRPYSIGIAEEDVRRWSLIFEDFRVDKLGEQLQCVVVMSPKGAAVCHAIQAFGNVGIIDVSEVIYDVDQERQVVGKEPN